MNTYTPPELIRFIEAAGESSNIDAKGPMLWDSGEASAGLTKDILAFANSRDGGVIVIGKDEVAGKFVLTGLTMEQAESFETTKVATWVNNRCAPPVGIVCHRIPHDGKEFVILTVAEFHDVPVICTKHFELPRKPPKVLLRNGAIYVRTANAESAPLSSIEDLRALIGLATAKRADQMLTMFQAMMKGRPLVEDRTDDKEWESQRQEIDTGLKDELKEFSSLGRWEMTFHPVRFRSERWPDASTISALVQRHSVQLRNEFPAVRNDTHIREWGICGHDARYAFALTRSGLFAVYRFFHEDRQKYNGPWQPSPDIPEGKWMEFQMNMASVIEFFLFMSRFCNEFDIGEEVEYTLAASPLNERRLISMNWRIDFFDEVACRASNFRLTRTVGVENLRANWEDECGQALVRFFELFGTPRIEPSTFREWIERFKQRTFWD